MDNKIDDPVDVRAFEDTLCIGPFTCVRSCTGCGVLINGGPTRCMACVRFLESEATPDPAPTLAPEPFELKPIALSRLDIDAIVRVADIVHLGDTANHRQLARDMITAAAREAARLAHAHYSAQLVNMQQRLAATKQREKRLLLALGRQNLKVAGLEKRAAERDELRRQLHDHSTGWVSCAEQVGLRGGPGAMQQAAHMADAACLALGTDRDDTSPSDIRDGIGQLKARIAELEAASERGLRSAIDEGLRSVGAPETSWSGDYAERVEQIAGAYHAECDEHAATRSRIAELEAEIELSKDADYMHELNELVRRQKERLTELESMPAWQPTDEQVVEAITPALMELWSCASDWRLGPDARVAYIASARAVLALRMPDGAVRWSCPAHIEPSNDGMTVNYDPANWSAAWPPGQREWQQGTLHCVFVPKEHTQ